ncbi:hypothetical protein KBX71_18610 [Micromonospora sp. D93]|uniref:hypothetical protein n=1 Tax=Micromonospora sp. D93 TaxID=2824886 RepID=UPI001B37087E|nr:hypothetical protein [Micromonospora sp. D93]MBQ1019861.1 hypothetical protein [Micromonospora sp. D93]
MTDEEFSARQRSVARAIRQAQHATDDVPRSRADGRAFGVDYRGAMSVTFELHVLGTDEAEVRVPQAELVASR